MTDPLPIPSGNECDDCSMCCVLASVGKSVTKTLDGESTVYNCDKLFWVCKCPGGALTMQRSSVDIEDWTPDGDDYWYPMPHQTPGTFRLKCTIDEGLDTEITYYSNEVTLGAETSISPCHCDDGGVISKLQIEIDVDTINIAPGHLGIGGPATGSYTLVFDIAGCVPYGLDCVYTWWGMTFDSLTTEDPDSGLIVSLFLSGGSSDSDPVATPPSYSEWHSTQPFGSLCKQVYACNDSISLTTSVGDHPTYHFWVLSGIYYYCGSTTVTDVRLAIVPC